MSGSFPERVLMDATDVPIWRSLADKCLSEKDFFLVPWGGDPAVALPQAEDLAPCTLVLSSDVVRQCHEQLGATIQRVPGVRVVVKGEMDEATRQKLLSIGVVGFLPSDALPGEMYQALKAVSTGEIWASRQTISVLVTKLVFQANAKSLSARELEILRLITKGYKNREIAESLCISRDTVRWHIRSLYTKIGASDRLSAVMYGRRFLIDASPNDEALTVRPA